MRGENGMVSANSRTQREEVKTYKYPRKAPELAWDLQLVFAPSPRTPEIYG